MNRTDDWYDIDRVTDRGLQVVEGPHYGQFLVDGSERAAVIDSGIGVGDLRGLVTDQFDGPSRLLLTHWHWDHIGNASQFDDVYIHPDERAPDGSVTIDALSTEFVHRPAQFAREWREAGNAFPDTFEVEAYAIEPAVNVSPMSPGDTVDLGDRQLEALHTPGHSPGHLSYLDREERVLYGGDVIHLDSGLYVHFEDSDLAAYLETFDSLIELRDAGAFDSLLTSHNSPFVGDELTILERLRDGLRSILDGEADATPVETAWGTAHRYEFDGSPVFTKPAVS